MAVLSMDRVPGERWTAIKILLPLLLLSRVCLTEAQEGAGEVLVHHPFDAVKGFFSAVSTPPRSAVAEWVTADFHLLEVGQVWDLARLLEAVQGDYQRKNFFDLIRSVVYDDSAWVSYWNRALIDRGGSQQEVTWLESAVLKRSERRWAIQLLHSTRIPPDEVPADIDWTEHR